VFPVDGVVERRNGLIETPGDVGRDRLGHARLGQDHEVVTADMTREVLTGVTLFENLEDDCRERLDHVVAAQEAVVIVVALERIDVRIQHCEALVLRQPAADLTQDVAVAAHASQRAEAASRGRARHHRAQARDELFRDEGLGHVVVCAGQKVLDLVLERVPHGQEDNGDQTRPKVLAQLRHDLVARHVAEHQVEQDDVWPPLDRRLVRGEPIVDGDALETRALKHALDQAQDLLVVIDHERDVAVDEG